MKKKDGFGHEKPNEGETNDWITPKWIIDAFDNKADGRFFDLDPCISMTQPWSTAKNGYNFEQNGLLQEWSGMVWCNPPYGGNIGTWARRMAKHDNGVMLIFARLETTAWFEDIFTTASGYLFLKGRIVFHKPDGSLPRNDKGGVASAGAPSAFVAWGNTARNALSDLCYEGILDEFGVIRKSAFMGRAVFTGGL